MKKPKTLTAAAVMAISTVLVLSLGSPPFVHAAGTVDDCSSYAGSGSGTALAEALGTGGIITFACNGTIVVPEIIIATSTTIDATGWAVTLSGGNNNRVFSVEADAILSLDNLTISDGSTDYWGGGINNAGDVSLTNCTVSGNYASVAGGGINNDGTMTLTNSTVSENSVSQEPYSTGGGIYNLVATLTLSNSTVSGNSATFGGGIYTEEGDVTLTNNSTVSENTATNGGGIYNEESGVTLSNSTVSENSANNQGGGIYIDSYHYSTLALTNDSTVSENSANDAGGGIYTAGGTLIITNSTVSENTAANGGGIYTDGNPAVTLTNSIVDGNYVDIVCGY